MSRAPACRQPVAVRRGLSACAGVLWLGVPSALALLGCGARELSQEPVVIGVPAAESGASAVDSYYSSICDQVRSAWSERDVARVEALLATHDREDAPKWAREQMRAYRALLAVDAFERALTASATITRGDPTTPVGSPTRIDLRVGKLPAEAGVGRVVLGPVQSDHATRFEFTVEARDYEPAGGRSVNRTRMVLSPHADIDLTQQDLTLPFLVEEAPPGVVLRELSIRVELLPGKVLLDNEALPLRRVVCCQGEFSVWPGGIEPIRKAPLTTLRQALLLGDEAHHPHVWLAARLLKEPDRSEGLRLLLDSVRLGPANMMIVAMAAAREIVGERAPPIGDREAWLAWWQARGSR